METIRSICRLFRHKLTHPSDAADGMLMSGLLAFKSPFLIKAVVEALHIQPDDDVLELGIGFGDGALLSYRDVMRGKGTIYSVDRSMAMFGAAQSRLPKQALDINRIIFNVVPDARLLPFNNDFFDKIFHIHSSYFWTADLPETLSEMMRVLKPGGILVCGMHLKKLKLLEKMKLLRRRQFDPARYIFELEPAGFRDVRMEYVKGVTNKEYQLIFAKKPLQMLDMRDPDELAAYLQERFMKEYIIERGIEEGYTTMEIERELASELMDSEVKSLELDKSTRRIADS